MVTFEQVVVGAQQLSRADQARLIAQLAAQIQQTLANTRSVTMIDEPPMVLQDPEETADQVWDVLVQLIAECRLRTDTVPERMSRL